MNASAVSPSPHPSRYLVGAGIVWAVVVLAGIVAMDVQMTSAGAAALNAPTVFPAESSLPAPDGEPMMLLFLHPGCSCSRATLHELERLLTDVGVPVSTVVAFVRPEGAPHGLVESSGLLARARAMPGVVVHIDDGGVEAARFASATSGQVLAYDERGIRRFVGGITPGRGHEGDSAGRERLLSLLRAGVRSPLPPSAVYGCELTNEGSPR